MLRQGWKWKKLTADSSGSGRQLLNLFEESPLTDEELLSREVIQNSKDAAATLRDKIAKKEIKSKLTGTPEFRMEFDYRNLSKKDVAAIWEPLGMAELKDFLRSSLDNKQNNSKIPHVDLLSPSGMSVLMISDFGCTGLGGDLKNPKISNYFRALISIGVTGGKQPLSGGTRGYGKAAFVAGSGIFTVFAYSKFPKENNYAATRHFGGVVYTFDHTNGEDYTGVGTFGDIDHAVGQVVPPLVDSDADALASLLNLPDRSMESWNSFGTTLVMMCPTVDMPTVIKATEKFWWPSILDGELEIDFFLPGEEKKSPRPKSRNDLAPYFAAYQLAKGDRDANPPYEYSPKWPVEDRTALNKEVEKKGPKEYALGSVGYKIDPKTGFIDPESMSEESNSTSSYVALIRSTGMVINYQEFGFRKDPVVHGVLIASLESESILQAIEPPSHSRWFAQKKLGETRVAEMLDWIEERLWRDLRELKRKVQPPDDLKRRRIEILSKAFGELFKAKSKGKPQPPTKPKQEIQIQWIKKAELEQGVSGGESRRYRSKIRVRVMAPTAAEIRDSPEFEVNKEYGISLITQIIEDESVMSEALPSHWIGKLHGFTEQIDGSLVGKLVPGKWVDFESISADVGLVRVMVTANVKELDTTSVEVFENE